MGAAQERMRAFAEALAGSGSTGLAALDEAVRSVSNFSGAADWAECLALELRHCSVNGRTAAEFFSDIAGVVLDNADTGAITGSDAGGDTVKTAESIVPESGSATLPSGGTSYFGSLAVHWPSASTTAEERVLAGLNSWWMQGALDRIYESYGISFGDGGASVREITVNFSYSGQTGALASTAYYFGDDGVTTALRLSVNMSYFRDITSDPNGVSSSAGIYLDRVIAHEMVHGAVAAHMASMHETPIFFREGIAELVHGVDDTRRSTLVSLASSESVLRGALDVSHTSGAYSSEYAAGYLALRYLARRGGSVFASAYSNFRETSAVHYDLNCTAVVVEQGTNAEVWLDGRTGTTYIPGASNIDASSSDGTVLLAGNDQGNVIRAGRGTASLWGGAGGASDVMVGGSGADTFFYEAAYNEGTDYIQSSDASDRVMLYGGTLPSVVAVGDGNLTLAFGGGNALVIQGWDASGMNTFADGSGNVYRVAQGTDGSWGMVRA